MAGLQGGRVVGECARVGRSACVWVTGASMWFRTQIGCHRLPVCAGRRALRKTAPDLNPGARKQHMGARPGWARARLAASPGGGRRAPRQAGRAGARRVAAGREGPSGAERAAAAAAAGRAHCARGGAGVSWRAGAHISAAARVAAALPASTLWRPHATPSLPPPLSPPPHIHKDPRRPHSPSQAVPLVAPSPAVVSGAGHGVQLGAATVPLPPAE